MIRPEEYFYVASRDDGWHKIGRTINPKQRIRYLTRDLGYQQTVTLVNATPCGRDASHVEVTAHWLLSDHENQREWFKVTAEQAANAVEAAKAKVAAGERPTARFAVVKRLTVRDALNARIDAALRSGETRQRFMEAAIEAELQRREKQ